MKLTDFLSADEIKSLVQASDFRGFLAVATTWIMITGCFVLVAFYPNPLTILLSLIILGGRHLALAILMHDASHYSLFRTRSLNDLIGSWICAYPTWQDLSQYRKHHLRHHRFTGTPEDPDLSLVRGFPTTKASLARKFLRDLFGISGIRRIYALFLMAFGYIEYTVAADAHWIPQTGRTKWDILKTGVKNLFGVFITNLFLFAILAWARHPELYLLWIVSYLTFFSLFVRIRSLAEHAMTEMVSDPMKNTRSTQANPLARITVAPHRVNYHLEHHLLMTVPYFKLPYFHRLLKERGGHVGSHQAENYRHVLKLTVS